MNPDRHFGMLIDRLIRKQHMTRPEAKDAFHQVLDNAVTPMQQGAFLAALRAKGETAEEVAGAWAAIYDTDTVKARPRRQAPLVENSGTGMDSCKTFNISTAAAIVAAAEGVAMARHGARAITSTCGTVDMAEALGVDVDCDADRVVHSIETAGIGLFNGMSPAIHPRALGRILSQIHFGTSLNIAASLANPAMPQIGVRGVAVPTMIEPVVQVMRAIGYRRALVIHGEVAGTELGMDEASVCGATRGAELFADGTIRTWTIQLADLGLARHDPLTLQPDPDRMREAKRFVALIRGQENGGSPRRQALLLNAALVLQVAGKAPDTSAGMSMAAAAIDSGRAYAALEQWVTCQHRRPQEGLARLQRLVVS